MTEEEFAAFQRLVNKARAAQNAVDEVLENYDAERMGLPANREERRFYRLIEEREMCGDGTQEITLACGHILTYVIPIRDQTLYAPCGECILNWTEAEKRKGVEST